MRICVKEIAGGVYFIFCRERQNGLPEENSHLIAKRWWLSWCFSASFSRGAFVSAGGAAMHHAAVYICLCEYKRALIALGVAGQGWMCAPVCASGCLEGKVWVEGVYLFIWWSGEVLSAGCVSRDLGAGRGRRRFFFSRRLRSDASKKVRILSRRVRFNGGGLRML